MEAADQDLIFSKRKAISALLPYAMLLEQEGHHRMLDAILRAARTSYAWWFLWFPIRPYIAKFLDEEIPPSLNRAIVLTSPQVIWNDVLDGEQVVVRWAAAVSAVAYTEEVCQSVVDTLLQISAVNSLRPHIPVDIWQRLKRRPSLPPGCRGRKEGSQVDVIQHVRGLGDIEILTSYLLLLWSEWVYFDDTSVYEMRVTLREDFGGTGLERNRKELSERLDHVLMELGRDTERFRKNRLEFAGSLGAGAHVLFARDGYKSLRETLLEVEKKAVNTPVCASPKLALSVVILIPMDFYRTPLGPTRTLPPLSSVIPVPSVTSLSYLCASFSLQILIRLTLSI